MADYLTLHHVVIDNIVTAECRRRIVPKKILVKPKCPRIDISCVAVPGPEIFRPQMFRTQVITLFNAL